MPHIPRKDPRGVPANSHESKTMLCMLTHRTHYEGLSHQDSVQGTRVQPVACRPPPQSQLDPVSKRKSTEKGAREPELPSDLPPEHSPEPPSKAHGEHSTPEAHYSASFHARGSKVALPLLPVKVSSPETGKTVETYALLDSGSKVSLCQDRLLESLGATGQPKTMELTTLEKQAASPSQGPQSNSR